MRRVPPASPGIAANQKSCVAEKEKPMPGSRTTSALTTNQVANDRVKLIVVMIKVRQATLAPVVFQNSSFQVPIELAK